MYNNGSVKKKDNCATRLLHLAKLHTTIISRDKSLQFILVITLPTTSVYMMNEQESIYS